MKLKWDESLRIFKYNLTTAEYQEVEMPGGAEILTLQLQFDAPVVWARVNTSHPPEKRRFAVYGTGNPISAAPQKYVGSFQQEKGEFVFHVFELVKE